MCDLRSPQSHAQSPLLDRGYGFDDAIFACALTLRSGRVQDIIGVGTIGQLWVGLCIAQSPPVRICNVSGVEWATSP